MKILVLDADWPTTAFFVTELSQAGFDVSLASPSRFIGWGLEQYCHHIATPSPEDRDYAGHVRTLIGDPSIDCVYATFEIAQQVLWDLPSEETVKVFPKTTALQRQLLGDRSLLINFVTGLGVPVPRMQQIADLRGIESAVANLCLPLVLRGSRGCAGTQVRIVDSLDGAYSAYRELEQISRGTVFGQEFIRGRRCLVGGLFKGGKIVQLFSQRTLEQCYATGPSIRVRSLRDPILTCYANEIFGALQWDGLACAEFMHMDTGEYRFLEINARPWGAILAAHRCGVPLLRSFARHLAGVQSGGWLEHEDGVEYTLFPAFFEARIRSGEFPRLRDVKAYLQALVAAPWSRPPLMRHYLQHLWWEFCGARKHQLAPVDQHVT